MRLRIALLTAVVVGGFALAGCAGTLGSSSPTTTGATPGAGETTSITTSEEPEKGDNLLSVSRVDDSTAMKADESDRANFSVLSERQQDVFLEAYDCSCTVRQDVFEFNDRGRIEYVRYEGQWYFVRVAIV